MVNKPILNFLHDHRCSDLGLEMFIRSNKIDYVFRVTSQECKLKCGNMFLFLISWSKKGKGRKGKQEF